MPDRRSKNGARAIAIAAMALVSLALVALLAGSVDRAGASASGEPGGPFTLVDPTGAAVTETTYRGKWELIYFGYTYCPDLCPATLAVIDDALDRLGPLASVLQPIFVTLDPGRDTPEIVGAYLANFDHRIVGLSGSAAAIEAAARQFHVHYKIERTGNGPDDYLIDHSGFLYLMNPAGRFVRVFSGTISGAEMAEKLRRLIAPAS